MSPRKKNLTNAELLTWMEQQAIKDENNCWNWSLGCNRDGYGQISYKEKTCLTHRLILILKNIKINNLIIHICSNRKCFNPEHLKPGSPSDNMRQSYEEKPRKKRVVNPSRRQIRIKLEDPSYSLALIKDACQIDDKECWNYPVSRTERYGMIGCGKKTYRIHRLVLSFKLKKQYEEIKVSRHLCHNKKCCNPEHLDEGSHSDNMLDTRAQGIGAILTKEKVEEILLFSVCEEAKLMKATQIDEKFSKKFNVARRTIQSARIGISWNDVYTGFTHPNKIKMKRRVLTEENVKEVLIFSLSNEAQHMQGQEIDSKFSIKFGVSKTAITGIRYGTKWKNIFSSLVNDKNKHKLSKIHNKFIK